MNDFQSKLPPCDLNAERSLLGAALRDNEIIAELVGLVSAGDFHTYAHGLIFGVMVELDADGKPADIVTVAAALTAKKKIEEIGGYCYLADLHDAAPSASHFRQYAEIVKKLAVATRLSRAAGAIGEMSHDRSLSAAEMLADAERQILAVAETWAAAGDARHVGDTIRETWAALDERRARSDNRFSGMTSGFIDLDTLTAGFQNSSLIVLASRPSVGKTALAVNIARHVALEEKASLLFVSLEQSRVELTERLLCCQGQVDSHRMRTGRLRPAEADRLFAAAELLTRTKLFIDDSPGQTILQIGANARRLKRSQGVRIVIIDYLQLITIEGKKETRQEAIANVSRRLKLLARELKIPVIVLAQLNRQVEARADQRPKPSDLRESGALEQDADVVMLLHRRDSYEAGQHDGLVDLIVAKHRNGPTGDAKLVYVKQHMRFENFAVRDIQRAG